jgi:apolipoprotein N-acyltransferase
VLEWAESFLFAGGSALLLLLARLSPHFWYLSLFALTPFLYRIITSSPQKSPRLGFLFGLSFFGAYLGHSLVTAPFVHSPTLAAGTLLFSLFGWAIGWSRERWGFSASVAALLWTGLEIGLLRFGFAGGILAESGFSDPFLQGLVSLFGFLTVSALIVIVNSLLILAVLKTLEMVERWREAVEKEESKWYAASGLKSMPGKTHLVPEGRAPPCA